MCKKFKLKHLAVATLILSSAAALTVQDANAASRGQIRNIVVEEANRHGGVPVPIALAVAKVESDFQDDVVSNKGARGVMQIMPKTAYDVFGVDKSELWEPRLNVRLGIKFLSQLHAQYGNRWDLALSHYNGGTLKGRGANARPHSYTRKYVDSVFRWASVYDREQTVAALNRKGNQYAAADNNEVVNSRYAYWNDPTPETEKNWRHYLNVANKWLNSDFNRQIPDVQNPENGKSYVPVTDDRPSSKLKDRLMSRSKRFRELMNQDRYKYAPVGTTKSRRFI